MQCKFTLRILTWTLWPDCHYSHYVFGLANVICTYLAAHLVCNHLRFTASMVARWCRTCRRFWRTLGVLVNKPLSAPLLVAIGGMWWCMPSIRLSASFEFHLDVNLIWMFNVCEALCRSKVFERYLFMEFHKEWESFKQGLVDKYCQELKNNFGSCLRVAEERMQDLLQDHTLESTVIKFILSLCFLIFLLCHSLCCFNWPFRFLLIFSCFSSLLASLCIVLSWFGRRHGACR